MQKFSQYIFILGNNPELSKAEIKAVLPSGKILTESREFLVLENNDMDPENILRQLGGTVKIGRVIGDRIDEKIIVEQIKKRNQGRKINFGFSFYEVKPNNLGLAIKKTLKTAGLNSRLVVSRNHALSSVIVKKEKCLDFLVVPGFLGLTETVQDFEEYGEFDYGRPGFDARSGMLPLKVAKMMINLSGAKRDDTILDPFCGSGTVLTQALTMGFANLAGCDISEKAVSDTKKNIEWIINKVQSSKFKVQINNNNDCQFQIFLCDIKKLSETISHKSLAVSHVITEPYLGPAWRGEPAIAAVIKTKTELENLYFEAFVEFKKILRSGGRVVMVFPQWHLNPIKESFTARKMIYKIDLDQKIADLGFSKIGDDLIYRREGQRVWRVIKMFEYGA